MSWARFSLFFTFDHRFQCGSAFLTLLILYFRIIGLSLPNVFSHSAILFNTRGIYDIMAMLREAVSPKTRYKDNHDLWQELADAGIHLATS